MSPVYPTVVTLEQFYSGSGPWDDALDAALLESSYSPMTISVGPRVYIMERRHDIAAQVALVGAGSALSAFHFVTKGNAGLRVLYSAGQRVADGVHSFGVTVAGLQLQGPAWQNASDVALEARAFKTQIADVACDSWGRNGLALLGWLADPSGASNANGCALSNIRLNLCGHGDPAGDPVGAGLYVDGPDANASTMAAIYATNCRVGVLESSFLGNRYLGVSAEACNNRFDVGVAPADVVGRGIVSEGLNNASTWIGSYCEQDSDAWIDLPATIIGGTLRNRGTAPQLVGGVTNSMQVRREYQPTEAAKPRKRVTFNLGAMSEAEQRLWWLQVSNAVTQQQLTSYGLHYSPKGADDWLSLRYANLDSGDTLLVKGHTAWIPYAMRRGVKGTRFVVAESISALGAPDDGGQWALGDRVAIRVPTPGTPSEYVLTTAGWKACGMVDA